jgi:hypothetical protein
MPNANGYLKGPNVLMYALIALIGGGGGVVSNQTSNAAAEKASKVERRVDSLETDTAVIKEKLENIEDNQARIEGDNKDRHEDLIEAIQGIKE